MMIGVKAPNNVKKNSENEKLPRKLLSFNAYPSPPLTSHKAGGSERQQMYLNNDRKFLFFWMSTMIDKNFI